jgi:hypothetical protein
LIAILIGFVADIAKWTSQTEILNGRLESMDTALYFPYLRVPQTPWFTQVLLYWDKAASIVPQTLLNQPDDLDPYMRELADNQLLEYVWPDAELYQTWEVFDSAFIELLEQQKPPVGELRYVRLHIDKMSRNLFEELRRRGRATLEGGPEYETWWQVEEATAGTYMAYLACAMSAAREQRLRAAGVQGEMLPVTDQEQSLGTVAPAAADLIHGLAQLRYAAITEALPAPRGPVPPKQLRAFKEENSEALLRCRRHLDGKLADLAILTDPQLRQVKGAAISQEIEDDVARLHEQMNKKRWPGVVLVGFGGVMGAALATAAVLVTGGSALAVGLGVGAGVLQLGGAAHTTAELIKKPRYDPRAPLAYAALAARL